MKYDYQLHLEVENNSHTQIIRRVPKESSVLELGCATGYMSAHLQQQLGCRVTGVELDPEAARQAEAHCERVIQANVEDPSWLEQLQGEAFDVITCADILEHLHDPEALLRRLTGHLNPGGMLLASIPNAAHASLRLELLEGRFTYQDTGLLDRTHLHLFTHQAVRSIFGRAGYRVDELSYTFHDMADSVIRERLHRVGLEATKHALAYLHTPEAAAYQFIIIARPGSDQQPGEPVPELTDKPLQDSLDVFSNMHDELHRTQVRVHEHELEQDRLQRDNGALHQQNQALEQAVAEQAELQRSTARDRLQLQNQLAVVRKLVKDQQRELERLVNWQQEVFRSTSWRLTGPLRGIGRVTAHVRRLLSLLFRSPGELGYGLLKVVRGFRYLGWTAGWRMLAKMGQGIAFTEQSLLLLDPFDQAIRQALQQGVERLPRRPLISVLLPTYNTPASMLRQALDSVQAQLYPDWELCVVDDASSQPQVRKLLQRYARGDSRIRLHFSAQNQGISRASNRALEMAAGEYVALMDHDDLLQPQALFRIAQSINAETPDLIYSDEALFAEDRSSILQYHLRPAFSLERLRSHPYIVHLAVFRTQLLRDIGGFDAGLSISQDYDLILRACERSQTVVHIPEVLYMWRERRASAGFEQRASVADTSRQVIEQHLERCGLSAEVAPGGVFNFYRLDYPLPPQHRVAVVIPTKNHWQLVQQCIESLERTVHQARYDLVIVDHASDEAESKAYFDQLAQAHRVVRVTGPFNFSVLNNRAVAGLGGDYSHYLFCNNDIEATTPGWLEHMLGLAGQADVGIVGAKLLYPDGDSVQHAGVCVGLHGAAEHYGKFMSIRLADGSPHPGYMGSLVSDLEVSAVTAACMLIGCEAFDAVQGFDEQLAVGFGDVDLCLRVRQQGYRVVQSNHAVLLHHESYSRGKSRIDPHPEDSALFRKRWRTLIEQGDPYYNPNLTPHDTHWSIAMRPPGEVDLVRRIVKKSV